MVQVSLLFVLEAQRVKTSKHPSPPPLKKKKDSFFAGFRTSSAVFFDFRPFIPFSKPPFPPLPFFADSLGAGQVPTSTTAALCYILT